MKMGCLHSKNHMGTCSQVPNACSHALRSYSCMCFHAGRACPVRQQFLNSLVQNLHNFYERCPLSKPSRILFHLRTDPIFPFRTVQPSSQLVNPSLMPFARELATSLPNDIRHLFWLPVVCSLSVHSILGP
jgi:hypothetical protein